MILVDTDVLIEFRRGSADAVKWVAALGDTPLSIPGVVALELIAGSLDRSQLESSDRFVSGLDVRWHTEADNELAYRLMRQYRLSTGLSIQDFLIAAQAMNLGATLFSFNLKHFNALPSLDAQAPYAR